MKIFKTSKTVLLQEALWRSNDYEERASKKQLANPNLYFNTANSDWVQIWYSISSARVSAGILGTGRCALQHFCHTRNSFGKIQSWNLKVQQVQLGPVDFVSFHSKMHSAQEWTKLWWKKWLSRGEEHNSKQEAMGFKTEPPTLVKALLLQFSRQTEGREVLLPGSWRSDSL